MAAPSNILAWKIPWTDEPGRLQSMGLQELDTTERLNFPFLSHPYMTTGKTIALTRWTFVGKVKSLLFNTLSRLEKAMAPHSSTLAWKIPWMEEPGRLQSMGSQKVRIRLSDLPCL